MDARLIEVATACLRGAENNTMAFPGIVQALGSAGFESYAVDFRRRTAIYYLASGDNVELPTTLEHSAVAADFDTKALQAAIKEAQQQVRGYTYRGFCQTATAAGCAGYVVSLPGRRAVYFGRTAETHVEHFPT